MNSPTHKSRTDFKTRAKFLKAKDEEKKNLSKSKFEAARRRRQHIAPNVSGRPRSVQTQRSTKPSLVRCTQRKQHLDQQWRRTVQDDLDVINDLFGLEVLSLAEEPTLEDVEQERLLEEHEANKTLNDLFAYSKPETTSSDYRLADRNLPIVPMTKNMSMAFEVVPYIKDAVYITEFPLVPFVTQQQTNESLALTTQLLNLIVEHGVFSYYQLRVKKKTADPAVLKKLLDYDTYIRKGFLYNPFSNKTSRLSPHLVRNYCKHQFRSFPTVMHQLQYTPQSLTSDVLCGSATACLTNVITDDIRLMLFGFGVGTTAAHLAVTNYAWLRDYVFKNFIKTTASNSVNLIHANMNTFYNTVHEVVTAMLRKAGMLNVAKVVITVLAAYCAAKLVISLLNMSMITLKFVQSIVHFFGYSTYEVNYGPEHYEPQGIGSSAAVPLCLLFTAIFSRCDPSTFIRNYRSFKSPIADILEPDTYSQLAEYINLVTETLFGFQLIKQAQLDIDLDELRTFHQGLLIKADLGAYLRSTPSIFKTLEKFIQSAKILEEATRGEKMKAVRYDISKIATELRQWRAVVMATGIACQARPRPLFVPLYGPSRTGKNFVGKALVNHIYMQKTGKSLTPPDFYTATDGRFADLYDKQKVYIKQELCASADSKVNSEEVLVMLNYLGSDPVPMEQAAIEKKGTTHFCSEIVLTNANIGLQGEAIPLGIHHPTAFLSRHDLPMSLVRDGDITALAAELKKTRKRLTPEMMDQYFSFRWWDFYLSNQQAFVGITHLVSDYEVYPRSPQFRLKYSEYVDIMVQVWKEQQLVPDLLELANIAPKTLPRKPFNKPPKKPETKATPKPMPREPRSRAEEASDSEPTDSSWSLGEHFYGSTISSREEDEGWSDVFDDASDSYDDEEHLFRMPPSDDSDTTATTSTESTGKQADVIQPSGYCPQAKYYYDNMVGPLTEFEDGHYFGLRQRTHTSSKIVWFKLLDQGTFQRDYQGICNEIITIQRFGVDPEFAPSDEAILESVRGIPVFTIERAVMLSGGVETITLGKPTGKATTSQGKARIYPVTFAGLFTELTGVKYGSVKASHEKNPEYTIVVPRTYYQALRHVAGESPTDESFYMHRLVERRVKKLSFFSWIGENKTLACPRKCVHANPNHAMYVENHVCVTRSLWGMLPSAFTTLTATTVIAASVVLATTSLVVAASIKILFPGKQKMISQSEMYDEYGNVIFKGKPKPGTVKCKFGAKCHDNSPAHLEQYIHESSKYVIQGGVSELGPMFRGVLSKIRRNIFCMSVSTTATSESYMYWLDPKSCIVPRHSWTKMQGRVSIYREGDEKRITCFTDDFKMTQHTDDSLYLVYKPNTRTTIGNGVCDIKPYIASKPYDASYAGVIRVTPTDLFGMHLLPQKISVRVTNLLDEDTYTVDDLYVASGTVGVTGNCGLPYISMDKRAGTQILFATHAGKMGTFVTMSPLHRSKMSVDYQTVIVSHPNDPEIIHEAQGARIKGTFKVGTLSKPWFSPTKTGLTPSRLTHGTMPDFSIKKLISIKRIPGQTMSDFCCHYDFGTDGILFSYLDDLKRQNPLIWLDGFHINPVPLRVLTLDQCHFGDPTQSVKSMSPSGSPGPAAMTGVYGCHVKTREDLFWLQDGKPTYHPQYKARVQHDFDLIEAGHMPQVFVQVLLKDEVRKVKFVPELLEELPIARQFYQIDVNIQAVTRRYFGPIIAHAKSYCSLQGDAVGINPHNNTLTLVFKRIGQYKNIILLDGKKNDFTVHSDTKTDLKDLLRLYYPALEAKTIEAVVEMFYHAYFVMGKEVYLVGFGVISGTTITCLLNGLGTFKTFKKCYYMLQLSNKGIGYHVEEPFEKHVVVSTFGDDLFASCSTYASAFFDCRTIIDMAAHFGYTYTPIFKDEEAQPYYTMKDAELIQRTLTYIEGPNGKLAICHPISWDCIIKSLYYERKSSKQSADDVLESTLMSAAREILYHGRAKFTWFENTFKQNYETITQKKWPCFSYDEYWKIWQSSYDNCCDVRRFEAYDQLTILGIDYECQASMRTSENINAPSHAYTSITEQNTIMNKTVQSDAELQFNTAVRDEPSEQREMTHFEYTEETVEVEGVQSSNLLAPVRPMPDKTPQALLGRVVAYPTVTLTGLGALNIFDPISKYFEDPTISHYFKTFNYAKLKLKVKFQLTSAMQQYGYIQISSVYGGKRGTNAQLATRQRQYSSGDTHILSTQSAEGLELPVEFYYPGLYIPFRATNHYAKLHRFYMWDKYDHIQNGTKSIQLNMYIQAESIELAGYAPQGRRRRNRSKHFSMQDGAEALRLMSNAYSAYSSVVGDKEEPQTMSHQSSDLSKPGETSSDNVSTGVKQALWSNLTSTAPSSSQTRLLGLQKTWSPQFTNTPRMDLLDLVQLPVIIHEGVVTTAGEAFQLEIHNLAFPTWFAYYARFFRLARASFKFSVWVFGSPLVATRYKLSLIYSPVVTAANPTVQYDTPTRVFLARGDHIETFYVPYHAWTPYKENDVNSNHQYVLQMDAITKPTSAGDSMPGQQRYVIAMSAAPDAVFASVRHGAHRSTYIPQASLRALHVADMECFFEPIIHSYPEHSITTTSLDSIMRRFDERLGPTLSRLEGRPHPPISETTPSASFHFWEMSNFDQACLPFLFYHGGMEFKAEILKTAGEPVNTVTDYDFSFSRFIQTGLAPGKARIADGVFRGNTDVWPIAEFETPYISCYPFAPVDPTNDFTSITSTITTVPASNVGTVAVRAGQDFSLFVPNLLPFTDIWQEAL